MEKLLRWIDLKKEQHGNNVVLLAALALFTLLAIILGIVYALFIGVMYISPYSILGVSFLLVLLIVYTNRA